MKENALHKIIAGYRKFHQEYVGDNYADYLAEAIKKQTPRVMVIGCSDSRVNPAIVTSSGLGEIFVVNNVANLVPPYKEGKNTHHSTSAALEYAVIHLEVEHIIVLGHSGCGGIKALMEGVTSNNSDSYSFIAPWMEIAKKAKEQTLQKYPNCSLEQQTKHCEKESLITSLDNLNSFPWIKTASDSKKLSLHAWYFDIKTGYIEQYSDSKKTFTPLIEADI